MAQEERKDLCCDTQYRSKERVNLQDQKKKKVLSYYSVTGLFFAEAVKEETRLLVMWIGKVRNLTRGKCLVK